LDAFDIGYHRLEQRSRDRDESLDGAELRFLGEFAHMSATRSNGQARFFRQGYYLQPSYRIGLFGGSVKVENLPSVGIRLTVMLKSSL
jgi:hypothetical protein